MTRKLGQELRIYREHLAGETNRKLTEEYQSALQQQENKMLQAITSVRMLVRIHYIKKLQLRADELHNLKMQK